MMKFKNFAITIGAFLWTGDLAFADSLTIPNLTETQLSTLDSGGHVISVWRDKTREDAALDVFGAIDIAATPETIWKIMLDCERAKIIVNDMKTCEVLETAPDGSWDLREQKMKVGPLLPKSVSVFRSDYDTNKSIKISLAGGNMKVQDGLWTLTPLENSKTRVAYRATVLSKFVVPRGMIKRAMRKDVPEILNNMRDEALKDEKSSQEIK